MLKWIPAVTLLGRVSPGVALAQNRCFAFQGWGALSTRVGGGDEGRHTRPTNHPQPLNTQNPFSSYIQFQSPQLRDSSSFWGIQHTSPFIKETEATGAAFSVSQPPPVLPPGLDPHLLLPLQGPRYCTHFNPLVSHALLGALLSTTLTPSLVSASQHPMPLPGAAHLVSPLPLLCTSHPFLSPLPPSITHQVLKWSLYCWTQRSHFGAWCHPASVCCLLSSSIFPFIWMGSSGYVTSPLLFSLCRALLRDLTSSLIFLLSIQSLRNRSWAPPLWCSTWTSLSPPNLFQLPVPYSHPDQQPKSLPMLLPPSPLTANEAQAPSNSTPKHQEKNQLLSTLLTPYSWAASQLTHQLLPKVWVLKSILTQLECQRAQCIPDWQLPWVSLASRISSNLLNMVQALNNLNAD